MLSPSLDSYFLEVKKIKTVKKILKLRFLDNFFKGEGDKCDQEDWNVSDSFGIITPCSATYHPEVKAPISLKAATKASLRGKTTPKTLIFRLFSKAKTEKCDQKNRVTVTNLAWLYLAQRHIFQNLVNGFHWKQPSKFLWEVKKTLKI